MKSSISGGVGPPGIDTRTSMDVGKLNFGTCEARHNRDHEKRRKGCDTRHNL